MKNVAIILAGGVGRRSGLGVPKQFLKVAGKTILEHTVDVFHKHCLIDEIAIVIHPLFVSKVEEMVSDNCWTKVKKILNGGDERYKSSLSAIRAYEDEKINLIFHDGVRPLVSNRVITAVCNKLKTAEAVDVVMPAVDTIVEIDGNDDIISRIPNRDKLRRGQTPQGFRLDVIRKAYEIALKDKNLQATDDCGIVLNYLPETKIECVLGEECNIKLTNPEDVYLLDKLFQIKSCAIESGDLNLLRGKVIVIFGGTSGIGLDMASIALRYGAKVSVFSRRNNVDVSDIQMVKRSLNEVYEKHGRIDYVVNTAAILNRGPILHMGGEDINRLLRVNYLGCVNTVLASYEYIKKSQGQILQFTSSSYTRGRANYALYSSSKAAVVNFVQAIAEEWYKTGIRINCINPQRTNTPMRVKNFGIEDLSTLLSSSEVARISLMTLLSSMSGEVVDVKLKQYNY